MGKKQPVEKKTLRLKPGNHAFVPGSHAVHNNDNTSSDELHWYLDKYPHVKALLEPEVTESAPEIHDTQVSE